MLRLAPTTISLTMNEVKEFERHRRFRRYLAQEDALGRMPQKQSNPIVHSFSDIKDPPADLPETARAGLKTKGDETPPPQPEETATPRPLSVKPRRPPKINSPEGFRSPDQRRAPQAVEPCSPTTLPGAPSRPAPLPPPFSLGSRVVSDEHLLPSSRDRFASQDDHDYQGLEPPMTPPRQSSLSQGQSGQANSVSLPLGARFLGANPQSSNYGLPLPGDNQAGSAPSSPGRMAEDGNIASSGTTDPHVVVYNDSLPASMQPQTPQNVPEARHQSRLLGAYTAPVMRAEPISARHVGTVGPSRRRDRSPFGMETPGFRGLYGGIENSEDSTLFREGTRSFEERDNEQDEG